MVSVTGNFTSRAPLHPEVRAAISATLEQGWADPRKLSQSAHQAAILKNAALDEIAGALGIESSAIHISGEPALLPYLSIAGFLTADRDFYFSSIDQGKVRALARSHAGTSHEMPVTAAGALTIPEFKTRSIVNLQSVNGETGIRQDLSRFTQSDIFYIIDATRDIPHPELLTIASALTLDSSSWGGPQGLGFLVIKNSGSYRYPLPHIAPISVPGSYSLALLVGAATALRIYKESHINRQQLRTYAENVLAQIPRLALVSAGESPSPHYISALVSDRSSQELLRDLLALGVECDAGSACNPQDLTPSHVIAALSLPTDGHLRITLHDGVTESAIDRLAQAISEVLAK